MKDASGQKLCCFYFEEESGRRSAAKCLTKDEARRIVANVAELPTCWKLPTKLDYLVASTITRLQGRRTCLT